MQSWRLAKEINNLLYKLSFLLKYMLIVSIKVNAGVRRFGHKNNTAGSRLMSFKA